MKLRTFVKQSLVEILGGVKDANEELSALYDTPGSKGIGAINPMFEGELMRDRVSEVEFDVATTVTNSRSGEGAATIEVVGVKLGKFGGKISADSTAVSRVAFKVPVILPTRPVVEPKGETNE